MLIYTDIPELQNHQVRMFAEEPKKACKKHCESHFWWRICGADLIEEGYTGNELLSEFRVRQSKVRPAVEAMLDAAMDAAHGKGEHIGVRHNKIFINR